jgi:putative spermidine/putrescine transport system permease protein
LLLAPAMALVGVFFLGGVTQTVAQSLGYQPYLPGSRVSLDAYAALWDDPAVRASVLLTARVAVLSTLLAAVIGVGAALVIRSVGRARTWVSAVFQANLAVPHLVGALCMALLLSQSGIFSRIGYALGLVAAPADFPELTNDAFGVAIIAEYVWKEAPFFTVLTLAALVRGVADLENAAATLGARPWQRLVHVTLPVLAPTVAAGSVLVLAFSAGSFEVPYLLGRPYPATLPVVALTAFQDPDLSSRPTAMAIAVVISLSTGLAALAYLALAGRLARRSL